MTSPPVATRAGLGVGARDNCEVALVGKLLRLVARRGVGQLPAPEASITFSSTVEAVCGAEGVGITCFPQKQTPECISECTSRISSSRRKFRKLRSVRR